MLWLLLWVSQFDPNYSPKYGEAAKLLQQQRFGEAAALLEGLTAEKPGVGEYWMALGMARAAEGKLEAALGPLEKACRSEARLPRACWQWGRVLQALGRHEEALAAMTRELRGYMDSQMLVGRAMSQEAVGRLRAADADYRAALAESALRPKNSAEVQLRYAQFLMRGKKWEEALWQLRQALRKQPFVGQAWKEKAIVLLRLGRREEAVDALEQALAHGERTKENLLLLSRVYAEMGEREKAEVYEREAR